MVRRRCEHAAGGGFQQPGYSSSSSSASNTSCRFCSSMELCRSMRDKHRIERAFLQCPAWGNGDLALLDHAIHPDLGCDQNWNLDQPHTSHHIHKNDKSFVFGPA